MGNHIPKMEYSWRAKGKDNSDLIRQLKDYNIIRSNEVENAMLVTDRGKYSAHPEEAYHDSPHSIGYGQTISAPHMHAYCLETLKDRLTPGSKVLDVGSGSGYLSACFSRMVGKEGKVIGIDVVESLVEKAKQNMNKDEPSLLAEGRVVLKVGDGWKGDISNAPFDAIHVGAAADKVPNALVEQLKPGGKLVIPVGTVNQSLVLVVKGPDGKVSPPQHLMDVRYVPLIHL